MKFGLTDFGVAPAGYDIPKTGHHHLIIDAPLPDLTLPIPANANYVHFGLGQTEAVIRLAPGKHTLCDCCLVITYIFPILSHCIQKK